MPVSAADRQRVVSIAIAILAIGLGGLGLAYVRDAEAVVDLPVPNLSLGETDSTSRTSQGTDWARPSGRIFDGRDPFAPVTPRAEVRRPIVATPTSAPASARWVVSSILFMDSARSAIVNDAWVSVGDRLAGGARVTEIGRKHVVVTDAVGTRHVVPLKEGHQ
jgi:hypothetical protein